MQQIENTLNALKFPESQRFRNLTLFPLLHSNNGAASYTTLSQAIASGTARITRGEEQFLLSENESTYIPIATKHRLENPGTIALEIIEVQSGSYLGEDDIVRFEDQYGRAER